MGSGKFFAIAASALAITSALAIISILTTLPAQAKQLKKVRAPFALEYIDRNGDRYISPREWDWAEKRGYDRVSKHGDQVTRKTYQAYVNHYYSYARQAHRYQSYRYNNPAWPGWHSQKSYGFNTPWKFGHP